MKRILIVEDDRRFRALLKRILEKRFGMEVFEAENGLKGLEVFKDKLPRLIFLDLEMPLMNGEEFLKRLREIEKEIPVIVVTNNNDYESVKKIIQLGVLDYILKYEMLLNDSERLEETLKKYAYTFRD